MAHLRILAAAIAFASVVSVAATESTDSAKITTGRPVPSIAPPIPSILPPVPSVVPPTPEVKEPDCVNVLLRNNAWATAHINYVRVNEEANPCGPEPNNQKLLGWHWLLRETYKMSLPRNGQISVGPETWSSKSDHQVLTVPQSGEYDCSGDIVAGIGCKFTVKPDKRQATTDMTPTTQTLLIEDKMTDNP